MFWERGVLCVGECSQLRVNIQATLLKLQQSKDATKLMSQSRQTDIYKDKGLL